MHSDSPISGCFALGDLLPVGVDRLLEREQRVEDVPPESGPTRVRRVAADLHLVPREALADGVDDELCRFEDDPPVATHLLEHRLRPRLGGLLAHGTGQDDPPVDAALVCCPQGEHPRHHAALHVAGPAPVDAVALALAAERVVRPLLGVAWGDHIDVTVQDQRPRARVALADLGDDLRSLRVGALEEARVDTPRVETVDDEFRNGFLPSRWVLRVDGDEVGEQRGRLVPAHSVLDAVRVTHTRAVRGSRIKHTGNVAGVYAPERNVISPFCAWRRFSAWSQTMAFSDSSAASVTSSPRWAGRQCIR